MRPETKRVCRSCGSRWYGSPDDDRGRLALWRARRARRRARKVEVVPPERAAKRGWSRCPSCFSTNVRDSTRV